MKMTVKEFVKLSKRDFDNGAVINEIWLALKERDEMELRIEKAKRILTMGHTIREREAFAALSDLLI